MTAHSLSPTSGSALKGPIMDTNNIYMEEFFAELLVSGDKLEAQPQKSGKRNCPKLMRKVALKFPQLRPFVCPKHEVCIFFLINF